MLPSTGHFKGFNCPFLESGLCERPYCHYRHFKRDSASQPLLQQLVSTAVKKLLRPQNPTPPIKPTYNPTPIAELNKKPEEAPRRHIPVPYTPYRPSLPSVRRNYPISPSLPSPEGYVPSGAPDPCVPTATYQPGGAAFPRTDATYSPTASAVDSPTPPALRYQPTPLRQKSPTFSSDDDEPAPKKSKANPSQAVDLDGLESEFEILGQILDDETDTASQDNESLTGDKKTDDSVPKSSSKSSKDKNHKSSSSSSKHSKAEKRSSSKRDDVSSKSKDKHSSDRKSKSSEPSTRDKGRSSSSNSKSSKSKSEHSSSKSSKNHTSKSSTDKSVRSKSNSDSRSRSESSSKRSNKDEKRKKSDDSASESHRDRKKTKSDEKPLSSKLKPVEIAPLDDDYSDIVDSFSETDEETIKEECLKFFEEYVPTPKNDATVAPSEKESSAVVDDSLNNKKRIAHLSDRPVERRIKPATLAPDHKANAVQLMADRFSKVKQFHQERIKSTTDSNSNVAVRNGPVHTLNPSKVRIAHVPYVSTMLNAKKNLVKPPEPAKTTIVQTVSKGTARVAHIPNDKFCDRPSVLEPLSSKIPVNIRSKYLNLLIDQSLKIYLVVEDAYERAQQEELATTKKCKALPIYKNSVMLAINRLRKEGQEYNGEKAGNNSNSSAGTVSHSKILAGKIGEKSSWSIENKYKKDNIAADEFKGMKFYNNMARWALSEKELQENGFPRPHPESKEKGRAIIYTKNTRQKPQKGNIRWCCRCRKEYTVDKKGFAIVEEECIYHPNNKYRYRGEVKYQCCSQDASSDGCLSAPCHVYEYVDHDDLRGFVRTLPKDDDPDEQIDHGVYALDCEMCYTTHGLDLTRVTVIDSSCKVVYESLVKPFYPIIDYNTRFSGLTEENMSKCTTTLLEVQATFLHMFSDKTILVGHSLESDCKALKLIHNTVVDTSVLFPHKMGPPYKRALRNLSSEYLKKIIQNSVDGHDSAEDALVCMELLIWKLREELKIR